MDFARTEHLPADAHVCLVSDLHIGDGGLTEPFRQKDDLFRRFLDEEASRADAFVIAGDGFDIARAWKAERIVRHHRALIDDLGSLARDMPVYYLRGNHEGSLEALKGLAPLRYRETLCIGDDILVEHGNGFDAYQQPGDRLAFATIRLHALIEKAVSSPVRIPMRKHYYWSTRLGHWLFYRYGQVQRRLARLHERAGRQEQADRCWRFLDYWGRGEWGDAAGLLRSAEEVLADSKLGTLVCGHSHQPGRLGLAGGTYVNTGSWTFDDSNVTTYRDGRFQVRDFERGHEIVDEEYRGILGANRDKSFFDWWDEFYLGWLRYDVDGMVRAASGDR